QYYGNQRQLEYDFRVSPGADPSRIAFDFSGIENASILDNGELSLNTSAGVLTHRQPVAYQDENGLHKPIEVRYVLRGKNRVGFELGQYDHSRPLVIDPVLVYSTYIGGTDSTGLGDQGNSIAVDGANNAYIVGVTSSTDFNGMLGTPAGGLDAFIM